MPSWLTFELVFAVCALVTVIISACGKCPIWVPVLFLVAYCLAQQLPPGNKG